MERSNLVIERLFWSMSVVFVSTIVGRAVTVSSRKRHQRTVLFVRVHAMDKEERYIHSELCKMTCLE